MERRLAAIFAADDLVRLLRGRTRRFDRPDCLQHAQRSDKQNHTNQHRRSQYDRRRSTATNIPGPTRQSRADSHADIVPGIENAQTWASIVGADCLGRQCHQRTGRNTCHDAKGAA